MRSALLWSLVLLSLPAAAEPESLLILDFKHEAGDEQTARLLNDLAAAAAERAGSMKVITGADIANVVALEAEKEALGCEDTSASCLAEVAGALGADLVLFGNVGRLGEVFIVTLNLFDGDKAQSAGRETIRAKNLEELPDAMERAVARLLGEETPEPTRGSSNLVLGGTIAGVGAAVAATGFILAGVQNGQLTSTETSGSDKDTAFVLGHVFFWSGVAGAAAVVGGAGLMMMEPE